jgi:myo-inositol 2-dehydrogenase/D-chiro-inositol 1-dehydrogenase
LERYEAAYLSEITHFVEAVNTEHSPSPSIIDGLKAQLIADAAAKSLATGQPVSIL